MGAARQSETIFWLMPVASSISSRTEKPAVRSTNFADARLLGDDRQRVGVPLGELLAADDLRALLGQDLGAVAELGDRAVDAVLVDDRELHRARHDDLLAVLVGEQVGAAQLHGALLARLEERLRPALRDAADVEGPHRQLRAGLADRLRGDDADRLAGVHLGAAGEVAPVALGADAVLGLAGERRADLHLDDARRLDEVGVALVDQVVAPEDHLAGLRVEHVLRRDAAEDALAERGHDLAVRDRGRAVIERSVPQSSILTMQSCATSTRRRVR